MYIKYYGNLYSYVYAGRDKQYYAITHNVEKQLEGFEKKYDFYEKIICEKDPNIQDIYSVDFYVDYIDKKQTMILMKDVTRWCVNDNRAIHRQPEIEQDELGIIAQGLNNTDGWVIYDQCSSSKIIHLSDCTGFIVKYTYIVKDGKKLLKKHIEEVIMTSDEFKLEMIKYHNRNI